MYAGTIPDLSDPEAVRLLNTSSFPPAALLPDPTRTLESCSLVPAANVLIENLVRLNYSIFIYFWR